MDEKILKLIKYWKKSSDLDFKSAKNISSNTKEYVNVLFLLHLSLEKCLKSYYVFKFKEHAPFTHNLLHLVSKLELQDVDKVTLSEINEFNIRCRYPNDTFDIYKSATKKKTEKLLKFGEEFREWIFLKLNQKQ